MDRYQRWILAVLFLGLVACSWWTFRHSKAVKNYAWFQAKLQEQLKKNQKEEQINQQLRRHITALQYDRRVIDQEARDQLTLTRNGEIVVILPR